MRGFLLTSLCCLTACGPWPDVGDPSTRDGAKGWPDLLPIDVLLETGRVPQAPATENTTLAERAAALRARAAILRSNASDLDALRARLNR